VLFVIASTTLAVIAVSLAFGAMAFGVARMLGSKVEFGRLYYMASLAAAPTFVFTIVINIAMLLARHMLSAAGFFTLHTGGILQVGGTIVAVCVTIYGFYLLTVAIGAICKFERPKAVATWLAPTAAILAALALLFSTVFLGLIRFLIKTI
jgi:hypothetical protein